MSIGASRSSSSGKPPRRCRPNRSTRAAWRHELDRQLQRGVEAVGLGVEVAVGDTAVDAGRVEVDTDRHAVVHGDCQRLGPAHPADAGGEGDRSGERAPEPLARDRAEGLEGALQDALCADVDPGACGHLAVHHQAFGLQLAEILPVGPVADQVGVGEQHTGRPYVRTEDADRLAGLHQHRLVSLQGPQSADDRVEGLPAAHGATGAAVDNEVVGMFRDLGVEVVHQHAKGSLLPPAQASDFGAARGPDGPGTRRDVVGRDHDCPSGSFDFGERLNWAETSPVASVSIRPYSAAGPLVSR